VPDPAPLAADVLADARWEWHNNPRAHTGPLQDFCIAALLAAAGGGPVALVETDRGVEIRALVEEQQLIRGPTPNEFAYGTFKSEFEVLYRLVVPVRGGGG
jgi:hypothetical protein